MNFFEKGEAMKVERVKDRLADCRRLSNMNITHKNISEDVLIVRQTRDIWGAKLKTLRNWLRMYEFASGPKKKHVMQALESGKLLPSHLIDYLYLRGQSARKKAEEALGEEMLEFLMTMDPKEEKKSFVEDVKKMEGVQQKLFDIPAIQELGRPELLFGNRVKAVMIDHIFNIRDLEIPEGKGSLIIEARWGEDKSPEAKIWIRESLSSNDYKEVEVGKLK